MPARDTRRRLLLGALLFLWGCGEKSAELPEVRIAIPLGTFGHSAVPLAQSLGFFEQEGVRVTLAGMSGSAKVMEAVISQSADIAAASFEQTAQLTAEGQPMKAFLTQFNGLPFPLVASPKASRKIARMDDLRGATVGVSSAGSQTHLVLNYLLSRHGLTPDSIATTGIGLGGSNVAAIEHGRVDAGVTTPIGLETLRRRHPDLTVLFDPQDPARFREIFGTDDYPSYVLCARTNWLEKNPELARKVARAVLRGLRHLHDQPVTESLSKLPPEYQSADPSVDIAVMQRWRHKFSRDGRFPETGYDAVLRVTAHSVEKVRLANIDPRTIYTNEFLENPVLKQTAPNEFTKSAEGAKP